MTNLPNRVQRPLPAISFALHQAVKQRLLDDPAWVIDKARANLARWEQGYGYRPGWMADWLAVLDAGVEAVCAILDGLDERSLLLKSSSPFTGIISPAERMRIIREQKRS